MTSYVSDAGLHASLKEKPSSAADAYLPHSHVSSTKAATSTSNKPPTANSSADSKQPYHRPLLTPELSLVSEDGQVLGIDVHTGLPKLAVELPPFPEMDEGRSMGPQISTRSEAAYNSQTKRERKSVSFEASTSAADIKRQRSMSDSKVGLKDVKLKVAS